MYYNTEALLKDVKNIEQYLEHDFSNYFNTMLQAAKDHTQKISAQVNGLKAAGVDLKKEMKILESQTSAASKNKKSLGGYPQIHNSLKTIKSALFFFAS